MLLVATCTCACIVSFIYSNRIAVLKAMTVAIDKAPKLKEVLTDDQLAKLRDEKLDVHHGRAWYDMDTYGEALHCPGSIYSDLHSLSHTSEGRVLFILLASLAGTHSALLKQLTPAAAFKWAKMLAVGKKVDLLHEPPEVKARAKNPNFSDEDTNPHSRAKKAKKGPVMLSPGLPPRAIIGEVPISAAELSVAYAPGVAPRVPLPAREEGDADPDRWTEGIQTVPPLLTVLIMFLTLTKVPLVHLRTIYDILSTMAALPEADGADELEWCSIPVL